ncbi:MAG: hypothetical protein ACRDTA_10285 [Pseudonocardiaceae bacterium]
MEKNIALGRLGCDVGKPLVNERGPVVVAFEAAHALTEEGGPLATMRRTGGSSIEDPPDSFLVAVKVAQQVSVVEWAPFAEGASGAVTPDLPARILDELQQHTGFSAVGPDTEDMSGDVAESRVLQLVATRLRAGVVSSGPDMRWRARRIYPAKREVQPKGSPGQA